MKLSPIINHLIALAYAGLLDGPVWTLSISFPEGSPYEKLRSSFSLADAKMEFGPCSEEYVGNVATSVKCGGLVYEAKASNPDILAKFLDEFFKACINSCGADIKHADINLFGVHETGKERTSINYMRRIKPHEGGDEHGD